MGVPDLIQVSPATANPAPAAGRNASAKGAPVPAFAQVLGAALAPGEAEAEVTAVRPKLAGTGKDLPEDTLKGDSEGDEDGTDAKDLPFAWFCMPQPLRAQATPLGIQLPRPANAIILPEGEVPGGAAPTLKFPGAALADAGFGTEAAPAADGHPAFALPEGAAVPAEPAAPAIVADAMKAEAPEAPVRIDTVTAPVPDAKIELRPHVGALVRPVGQTGQQPVTPQVAAASLMAVQGEALPQPRRTTTRDLAATALTAANPLEPRTNIVAPTTDAQQPALDMHRQEWMTNMIDRIDALRDSSGSRETNIRLSPDALGTVDVSIRQEGDRVHVRIHAATPEARALLAEAHPRLAELAEAKGIRLGQTDFQAGSSGQNAGQQGQRQDAPRAPISATPASARTDIEPSSDERVA
jgi:flagellar hook-length control protein FliK